MGPHILVPLDGSDPSWDALDHVIETFSEGHVTTLHVVDPTAGIYSGIEGGYYDPDAYDRAVDRGESLCADAKDRMDTAGRLETMDVTAAVESGRPARVILEYIEEHDVDHVVMGSHGRSGVTRILLGSVAETVTRRSPVPVTIVR